jgi:hypothetical protein
VVAFSVDKDYFFSKPRAVSTLILYSFSLITI